MSFTPEVDKIKPYNNGVVDSDEDSDGEAIKTINNTYKTHKQLHSSQCVKRE